MEHQNFSNSFSKFSDYLKQQLNELETLHNHTSQQPENNNNNTSSNLETEISLQKAQINERIKRVEIETETILKMISRKQKDISFRNLIGVCTDFANKIFLEDLKIASSEETQTKEKEQQKKKK